MVKKSNIQNAVAESGEDLAVRYFEEFKAWRNELEPYWNEIDKSQELYEFYKREYSETSSEVAFNTPFSIVESMVARFNETTLRITAQAKGLDGLDDFEKYIASVIHDSLEDPDVAEFKGTFRKLKEMVIREYLVKGNVFVETNYFHKTDVNKKVLADNPFDQILPLKSVIFNPAYSADNSPVYYVEKHVSYAFLKDDAEREVEVKEGDATVIRKKGKYKNLDKLRKHAKKDNKIIDAQDEHFVSDGKKIIRKVEPIRLLERWEGSKLCAIASIGEGKEIIREEVDPKKTGNSGLHVAMNYKIAGRPYAYGEITPIYRLVRAQDTILNQSIEVINRYLRPTVFVNDPDADLDSVILLLERGGAGYGDPTKIGSPQLNLPPQQAFTSNDVIQQAIERTTRWSPYAVGQLSQATDKTQGTASGIQSLMSAAEPNFQVKIDGLQDSWLRPSARARLKMIGNLMIPSDIRYSYLRGEDPKWVRATKGILTGQATIGDFVVVGMIKPDELEDPAFVSQFLAEFQLTEPKDLLEETIVFDTDWIVDVKLDNQSSADKQDDLIAEQGIVAFGREMGVQYSPERTISYFANKRDFTRHDDLMLTDEEKQRMFDEQQQQIAEQQNQQATARQGQAKQDEIARLEAEASRLEQLDMKQNSALALEQERARLRQAPVRA